MKILEQKLLVPLVYQSKNLKAQYKGDFKLNIIIAREGKEIYFLIKSFTSKGHEVIVINKNEETCKKIARIHETITVVCGDSTKLERV